MIRAVLFDAGGVLHVNKGKTIREDVTKTLGITDQQYDLARGKLVPLLGRGEITEEEYWQKFVKMTGTKKPLPKESLWQRGFKGFTINEGVFQIVRLLKERGLRVVVFSNTIKPHADVNRQRGIYDMFDVILLSNEVGMRKPDPKFYRFVLKELNLRPDEVILIDDQEENVLAGEKLGIKSIKFETVEKLKKWLQNLNLLDDNHVLVGVNK